jgi:hypothetical protein
MLKPEAFAVLPWGWTPGDRDALAGIRECGFNLAGFVRPEHLDLVREAGLSCGVLCSDRDAELRQLRPLCAHGRRLGEGRLLPKC